MLAVLVSCPATVTAALNVLIAYTVSVWPEPPLLPMTALLCAVNKPATVRVDAAVTAALKVLVA